ncbi:response regulator [Haloferula chungangensis]|uniref:Response regulator n=1 Tax=Haloferula chungangensis TaxID=1048331 RepID=A0ABW2LDG4_9BACT
MKVLIIDDSNAKITALREVVFKSLNGSKVVVRRSFQKALQEIERESYDIVLLDMTIPTTERSDGRFEGRTRYFGGRELLGEMDLLDYDAKVVIVTQFDRFDDGVETIEFRDLMNKLEQEFQGLLIGTVFYTSISDRWVVEIEKILKDIQSQ